MMVKCRFVGSCASTVGDREFEAVGQSAVFSENSFAEVLLGGASFIPEQYFNAVGFTHDELRLYGESGSRDNPPQSFCNKLMVAQKMAQEIRRKLMSADQVSIQSAISALVFSEPVSVVAL